MKLTGSSWEVFERKVLELERKWLIENEEGKVYWNILLMLDPNLISAYGLGYIPEQDSDIRLFITDKKEIYVIEIGRALNDLREVEKINFYQYKKNLRGRSSNLQFAVALSLIEEDVKKHEE